MRNRKPVSNGGQFVENGAKWRTGCGQRIAQFKQSLAIANSQGLQQLMHYLLIHSAQHGSYGFFTHMACAVGNGLVSQ